MNAYHGTERLIYEYILYHANNIINISAKVVANETCSTTTSVNRVCKKMGYASYTDLRYKFENDQQKIVPPTDRSILEEAGEKEEEKESQTVLIDQICSALQRPYPIYLYAQGATLTSLSYLSRFLSLISIPHLMLNDIHQSAHISQGILVLLSKSGETQAVIDMAQNAKRKGVKIVSITTKNSPLFLLSSLSYPLDIKINRTSLYQRESQLELISVIDRIGHHLLQTHI